MCLDVGQKAAKSAMERLLLGLGEGVRGTLTEKLAERIREAIAVGDYRPGDTLPTIHEFAERLGTSIKVPEAALQRLAGEGLIRSRPRLGSVVLSGDQCHWRGHILIVARSRSYVYMHTMLIDALRAQFAAAGYLVTVVSVRSASDSHVDQKPLRHALRGAVRLVVTLSDNDLVLDAIDASGIPYVVVCGRVIKSKGCVGSIPFSCAPAISQFAGHCTAENVRRVAVVGQDRRKVADAARQIAAAGIKTVKVVTGAADGFPRPEAVSRGALSTFARLLERRDRLPDVCLFMDDWVCSGALVAILEAGLSVPRDMRVVTLSNKGLGPIYSKPFTRLEVDHDAYSNTIAKAILDNLGGKPFPKGVVLSPNYVEGETF